MERRLEERSKYATPAIGSTARAEGTGANASSSSSSPPPPPPPPLPSPPPPLRRLRCRRRRWRPVYRPPPALRPSARITAGASGASQTCRCPSFRCRDRSSRLRSGRSEETRTSWWTPSPLRCSLSAKPRNRTRSMPCLRGARAPARRSKRARPCWESTRASRSSAASKGSTPPASTLLLLLLYYYYYYYYYCCYCYY